MTNRLRVAVIFGGRSSEHEISCISAGSVLRAIDRNAYDVVAIGITKQGQWVLESDDPDRLSVIDGVFPQVNDAADPILFTPDPTAQELVVQSQIPSVLTQVDVAFSVLHGPFGEDGTIQGLFELAGIPYVGSGVFSSAACMDKAHMKAMLRASGLPVGPYEVITNHEWKTQRESSLERIHQLGLPVFVKPSRAGSSVGITKVKDWLELEHAIELARHHDPKVVIEASIEGNREIECGVLGGIDGPSASVVAEIVVREGHDFYDYEAKYVDDSVELVVPANLPEELSTKIRAIACEAFTALDCEGLARVDLFINGSELLVNEINTMPGFTPISMFPRMWQSTGKSYSELVDELIQDAIRRGTGLR